MQFETPFVKKLMKPPDCLNELEKKSQFPFLFLKKEVPVDWNGRYETPAGKAWPRETPQANSRGRTARGKRVPGVEIITHNPFGKSAPFPPTVCQASSA
ncbi:MULTISPECIES: hypothetical protein [Peribacillus]|uniref:hypothetical protein n=1 Tax=Peribacillus TaxID=2675229 RepID=UPI0013A5E3C2|nr:hypothetical protein [Peribacillus frigoritolerans]MEC0344318.1 hypothetical protein [Peribacillus castrilensis]